MIDYLLSTEKQSVSIAPVPGPAGPGPAELGHLSSHGTGYASHCSTALIDARPAPSLGTLVRNAG